MAAPESRLFRTLGAAALLALAWSSPAAVAADPPRAANDQTVTAADVATTPLSSLNLKKRKIPAVLQDARANPYDMAGMTRCSAIAAEIADLDAALGADFDVAQQSGGKISMGSVGQSVVGSLIPFNGVIKEISGANASERNRQVSVSAGIARRAFLKGVGRSRGCPYPARPATARDVSALQADAGTATPPAKARKPSRKRR